METKQEFLLTKLTANNTFTTLHSLWKAEEDVPFSTLKRT